MVGGGPAGLTAAVALAEGGIATVLVGKKPAPGDNRTTALLASSVTALETLGRLGAVPRALGAAAVPAHRRRHRPPVARAGGQVRRRGDRARGLRLEHREPGAGRGAGAPRRGAAEPRRSSTTRCSASRSPTTMPRSRSGTAARSPRRSWSAPTAAARSAREAALIDTDERRYPQTALTVCFRHTRPHHETSTEFHTPSGQCTVVPLPGNRASLVWVLDPPVAEEMAALDDDDAVAGNRARHPFDPRQGRRRAGPRPVSARHRHRDALRPQPHRAGRRGGACHPAGRRAGSQSRFARRRHHRRAGDRRAPRRPRHRRRTGARALRQRCVAPTSAAAPSRSTCSTAACSPICCRCRARAASASICSTASAPCAAPSCARASPRRASQPRLMRGEAL